jgi:hypothetical protein
MIFFWFVVVFVTGVILGVVFNGKIGAAVKSLETTLIFRLAAIEAAIKELFASAELTAGAAIKSDEKYVEEIAAKVMAKLKADVQQGKV